MNARSKPVIAILDDYHHRAKDCANWDELDFAEVRFYSEPFANEQALVDALADVAAVGLMRERTPFPATLIEQLPNLKLIVTTGKKNAAIDSQFAAQQGITVCGTESPGHATAELALLLVMSLLRQMVPLVNDLANDNVWQKQLGRDIRGQTLGVLGLGRLGGQLAGFAQALGMRVIAWSENLTDERCAELGVEKVSRDMLFEQADVVSIHMRLSARTDGLINAEDLERLGANGYLVNTSRAGIVQADALQHALDNNIIAGAALDVFDNEPTAADDMFVDHPRVLATPHIGYCTQETFDVFYSQTVEAMKAFYQGEPIRVIASPQE